VGGTGKLSRYTDVLRAGGPWWGILVRVPVWAKFFFYFRVVQVDSGASPATYPMGTGVKRPGRESAH
jgi:hypothetical protein